jgi:hypothetical protein
VDSVLLTMKNVFLRWGCQKIADLRLFRHLL